MKRNIQTLLIVWMAVSALILSTACSRKSAGKAPIQTSQHEKQSPGELDDDSSDSSQESPEAGPDALVVDEDPIIIEETEALRAGDLSSIRSQLLAFVSDSTRADRRDRNQSFANSIDRVGVDIDSLTGRIRVSIDTSDRGRITKVGTLSQEKRVRIGSVRRGDQVAAEAVCLDNDGGCESLYVLIQDGKSGRVKTAHALVTTSNASIFTEAAGYNIARNEEYNYFLNLLLNTADTSGPNNKVKSLVLRTSEVIGAKSDFTVQMGLTTTKHGDGSVNFGGELVNSSSGINSPVSVLASTHPIADVIREARLTQNNGRGAIQLSLTIRAILPGAQEDVLKLTVSSAEKALRPLQLN